MSSNRRRFVIGAAASAALISLGVSKAQTPEASVDPRMWGGAVVRSDNTTRITWTQDEPELPGFPSWVPISLTTYSASDGDTYLFAELRNATGAPALAPRLYIEAFQGDFSFGVHEQLSDTPWVDVNSTAFYYGLDFFGGSLANSDWDGISLSVAQETFRTLADYDMSGLEIQEGRLINHRTTPVPPVFMSVFVRDKAGIFCGGCASMGTGANTPPNGGSVKLGDPANPNYVPGCGFSEAGMRASTSVGVGAPFKSEYRLVAFDV